MTFSASYVYNPPSQCSSVAFSHTGAAYLMSLLFYIQFHLLDISPELESIDSFLVNVTARKASGLECGASRYLENQLRLVLVQ